MRAAENLVYGYVAPEDGSYPLYLAAERLIMARRLILAFLLDIVVLPGATLTLAPSLTGVSAFRVQIYKTGRIFTPNYAKIHCHSVETSL
jgi:hypothetical protein